jgi:hypothetical protein
MIVIAFAAGSVGRRGQRLRDAPNIQKELTGEGTDVDQPRDLAKSVTVE